jgi:hypothetical protein
MTIPAAPPPPEMSPETRALSDHLIELAIRLSDLEAEVAELRKQQSAWLLQLSRSPSYTEITQGREGPAL